MKPISLIELPMVAEPRGNLSFVEGGPCLPFEIKRAYWIYDVPGGKRRFGRALKSTDELIVALSGSFDVVVDRDATVHLCRGYQGLLVPAGHWREIVNFSTNAVALVLASAVFDEADYERDAKAFFSKKSENEGDKR